MQVETIVPFAIEELGIERNEFVEQARTVGVELKSAMAALDEDQVELLREKLGGAAKSRRSTEEKRLEGKRGTTVVRRRRKKAPEPESWSAAATSNVRCVE